MGQTRSVSYGRQSKGNAKSISQQIEAMQQDADHEDHETVAVLQDSVSASRFGKQTRGDWPKLLNLIETNGVDVVRFWESSRGSREMSTWVAFLDACRTHQVLIKVVKDERTYNPGLARDRKSLIDDGNDSEYESEKMSERIRRTVLGTAAQGLPGGKLEYGYARFYNERREFSHQDKDPIEAPIVAEAAHRVAKGESLRSIELDFEARGILTRSGKHFSSTQIRRIVTNPTYLGKRVFKGEIVADGAWPQIIDQETYDLCIARIKDPDRKCWTDGSIKHLLTNIATCATCGGNMAISKNRGILFYKCMGKYCTSVKKAEIEPYVIAEVKSRMIAIREQPEVGDRDEQHRDEAQKRVAGLEDRLVELEDQLSDLDIPRAITARAIARTTADLEAAKLAAEARTTVRMRRYVVADGASFDERTVEGQRELVKALVTVVVKPAGRCGRYGAPPIEARVVVEDAELEEVTL